MLETDDDRFNVIQENPVGWQVKELCREKPPGLKAPPGQIYEADRPMCVNRSIGVAREGIQRITKVRRVDDDSVAHVHDSVEHLAGKICVARPPDLNGQVWQNERLDHTHHSEEGRPPPDQSNLLPTAGRSAGARRLAERAQASLWLGVRDGHDDGPAWMNWPNLSEQRGRAIGERLVQQHSDERQRGGVNDAADGTFSSKLPELVEPSLNLADLER